MRKIGLCNVMIGLLGLTLFSGCVVSWPGSCQIQAERNDEHTINADHVSSFKIRTSFGDIHTARGVLTRDVHKDRLRGTIGQGNGQVECHSSFGNVYLN